jgi:hypothetical protein
MAVSSFIDAVISLFGYGKIVLGVWPETGIISAALRAIEEAGGVAEKPYGTPDGQLDCVRFRFRGRVIRLCAEEMGEVTLFGPKQLIAELSQRIASQLGDTPRDTTRSGSGHKT